MGCTMKKEKTENKQTAGRSWTLAFGCLLVLVMVFFAVFWAWDSFCDIPKELPKPQDFKYLVSSSNRSEAALLERLYDRISRELAWHGDVDSIQPIEFKYFCQSSYCFLKNAYVWISVNDFPICTYERRISATVLEADISFTHHRLEPSIKLDIWRSGRLRKTNVKLLLDDITPDIAAIKEYVLKSIGDDVWDTHSSLSILLRHRRNGWSVEVSTTSPHEFIYHADLDRSEYRNKQEQNQ